MKKCRVTYDDWKCITEKECLIKKINTADFSGYLGRINIKEVSTPQIWRFNGEDITVCDNHYQWLMILPENDFYCVTAMMDDKQQLLVCYIDMIDGQGCDEDGIPFFYDLYLDLVVYPDGTIIEDDRDELEAAFESGDITRQQFELALHTIDKLQKDLLSDRKKWEVFVRKMYEIAAS